MNATMIEAAVVRETEDETDETHVIGKMTLVVLAPIGQARQMAGLLMYRPCRARLVEGALVIDPMPEEPAAPPPSPAATAAPAAAEDGPRASPTTTAARPHR